MTESDVLPKNPVQLEVHAIFACVEVLSELPPEVARSAVTYLARKYLEEPATPRVPKSPESPETPTEPIREEYKGIEPGGRYEREGGDKQLEDEYRWQIKQLRSRARTLTGKGKRIDRVGLLHDAIKQFGSVDSRVTADLLDVAREQASILLSKYAKSGYLTRVGAGVYAKGPTGPREGKRKEIEPPKEDMVAEVEVEFERDETEELNFD